MVTRTVPNQGMVGTDEAEPGHLPSITRDSPIRPERAVRSKPALAHSLFRRLIDLKGRLARAVAREGATAFAMRKGTQAVDRLTERARIGWHGLSPWAADGRPVFLFINHHCGGGTEQHVRDLSIELRERAFGWLSSARADAASSCGKSETNATEPPGAANRRSSRGR